MNFTKRNCRLRYAAKTRLQFEFNDPHHRDSTHQAFNNLTRRGTPPPPPLGHNKVLPAIWVWLYLARRPFFRRLMGLKRQSASVGIIFSPTITQPVHLETLQIPVLWCGWSRIPWTLATVSLQTALRVQTERIHLWYKVTKGRGRAKPSS